MSKDFFEMIVASIDSPLYVTDTDGTVIYANPAFEVTTGYRRKDGSNYVVLQYITPISDPAKEAQYFRLKFNQEMERELARSTRHQSACSLILFDIDHFKQVNDTFGHNTGDAVLKTLAELVESLRRETDFFCRWGGEEFVLLCPDTDSKTILSLAERIRRTVETHRFATVEHITVSLGAGSFLPEADTSETLIARVDGALYEAKRRGRNRVVSADHDIATD